MNINPLWFLCLAVRISLILAIYYLNKNIQNKKYIKIASLIIIFSIGFGFMRKGLIGSNNEIQIAKVFWHETRYIHGILYILSGLYLLHNNLNMCLLLLLVDVIVSVLYRVIFNK